MTINWNEDLSVGDEILDSDHKTLINLINKFEWAIEGDISYPRLNKTLDELEAYTMGHFKREEQKQEEIGYPQSGPHQALHRELVRQLHEHREKFNVAAEKEGVEGAVIVREIALFLKDWLIQHIMDHDKRYKPYLLEVEAKNNKATPPAHPAQNGSQLADIYMVDRKAIGIVVVVFMFAIAGLGAFLKPEAPPAPKLLKAENIKVEKPTQDLAASAPKQWWRQSKCEKIPKIKGWEKINHAYIVRYVAKKEEGDWDAYINLWLNNMNKLNSVYENQSKITVRGVVLNGDDLKDYLTSVRKRVDITKCLSLEYKAASAG
jgi:hemerythrin